MKNTFVKVLSFLMALTMIVGAFGAITVSAAECAHEPKGEPIAVVEPTCNSIGYTKYECALCAKEYVTDVLPAKASHSFTKWVDAKPATCDEPAYTGGWVCADCGTKSTDPEKPKPDINTEINNGQKLGHTYGTYVVSKDKTCTTNAYTANQCVRCDALGNKVEIPGTAGHEYVYTVNTATTACISGKVTITCSDCDYKDVIVETKSHTPVEMVAKAQTTGTALEKGYYIGTACGDVYAEGSTYCSVCYEVVNEVLNSAKAHNGTYVATIFTTGTNREAVGFLNTQLANLTIPGTNQKFTVGSTTRVWETCTTNGWELNHCSICKQYYVKTLEATEGGHKASDWSAWTSTEVATTYANTVEANTIQTGANHMYVFTAKKTCTNKHNNVTCGQVMDTRSTKATSHNYDNSENDKTHTVVVEVTCTVNGSVTYKCNYCPESHTDITAVAKGYHSFKAEGANPVWTKVSNYNCATNAVLETTCTHPECDTSSETGKQPAKDTKADPNKDADHNYALDVVAGTCMVPAHYQNKCTICNATATYTGEEVPANAAKNPSNHVAAYDLTNDRPVTGTATVPANQITKQEYSCTTNEIKYFICACDERVELITRKAPGHVMVTGGVDETQAGGASNVKAEYHKHASGSTACTNDCKKFEPVAATCTTKGQTAGKLCTTCGYVETPSTETAINPNAHVELGVTDAGVTVVPANCNALGSYYYNCTRCAVKVTKEIKNSGANNNTTAAKDTSFHVNMTYHPATTTVCVNAGMNAYYSCADCNKLFAASDVTSKTQNGVTGYSVAADKAKTKAQLTKTDKAADHTWVDVAVNYETCVDNGNKAFKYCSACQGGTITDGNYTVVKTVKVGTTVTADNATTENVNEAYNKIKLDAHGATYTKIWTSLVKKDSNNQIVKATCSTGAWIAVPTDAVCVYCELKADRTVTDKFVGTDDTDSQYWQKPLDHKKLEEVEGVSQLVSKVTITDYYNCKEVAGVLVALDCTEESFVRKTCSLCKKTWLSDYAPARSTTGHAFPVADAQGNYADGKVQTKGAKCIADGYKYVVCENANCGAEKPIETIPATGHYVLNGTGTDAVKTPISFECEYEEQYKGLACAGGCGWTVGVTVIPDHVKHNLVTAEVERTCTTDGYEVKYCTDCNVKFDANNKYEKAKGHDFEVTEKFKVAETTTAITYRCYVCGENYDVPKAAPEATLKATVTYSANTVVAGDKVDVVVTVSGKAVNYNTAVVTLDMDTSLFVIDSVKAGDAKAVAVCSGANVAIFVPNTADGAAQNAAVAADGSVVVTITLQAKRHANGSDKIEASVVFNKSTKNQATASAAEQKTELVVAGLGNINGDAYYTVEDAIAVYGYIGKAYNATADVNGDGAVTLDDAMAVAKFAASARTGADYFIMIGEYDKIEAYVADLYENGLLPDVDGDRVVLINDVYALISEIKATLNTTAYNYSTVEELVNYVITH